MKILVYIQSNDGTISRNSLEALALAQSLAANTNGTVSAISFDKELCDTLCKYKVDTIFSISSPELSQYDSINYVSVMEHVINSQSPSLVLFGHTYEVRDWVPRLSARLDIPFISDCVEINHEGPKFIRQAYQGKINVEVGSSNQCTLASVQSGSYKIETLIESKSNMTNVDIDLSGINSGVKSEKKFKEDAGGVDLTRAEIIVSVGRGVGKEENLPMIKELAEKMGAELGSSRPVVDAGWLDHSRQIGSSGQVVSPKLYFSIGVSGAIQHQVGMKGSDHIVAINKDKNAPIFEIADYAIVGDLLEIIPKLIDNI
tara:strand:- start:919 stop:1863 length:945 start_codon:yes stop_codon:yes gene_type:complete